MGASFDGTVLMQGTQDAANYSGYTTGAAGEWPTGWTSPIPLGPGSEYRFPCCTVTPNGWVMFAAGVTTDWMPVSIDRGATWNNMKPAAENGKQGNDASRGKSNNYVALWFDIYPTSIYVGEISY